MTFLSSPSPSTLPKKKKKSEIEANLKVKYWVERSFGNHLE
jgi:hypothetical protein